MSNLCGLKGRGSLMAWYRIYIDKEITDQGGGDHARTFDCENDYADAALAQLVLETDETANQIVSLTGDPS
jgi:hypothetical protein